jgi:flagellar basal body-associated protein FliL
MTRGKVYDAVLALIALALFLSVTVGAFWWFLLGLADEEERDRQRVHLYPQQYSTPKDQYAED